MEGAKASLVVLHHFEAQDLAGGAFDPYFERAAADFAVSDELL